MFGAFTKCEWLDYLGYFGDSHSFIFSYQPKFHTYYTYNGKGFYGYSENLDPHPNIARWIEYKVAEEVRA